MDEAEMYAMKQPIRKQEVNVHIYKPIKLAQLKNAEGEIQEAYKKSKDDLTWE